jgi:hypothetical protein
VVIAEVVYNLLTNYIASSRRDGQRPRHGAAALKGQYELKGAVEPFNEGCADHPRSAAGFVGQCFDLLWVPLHAPPLHPDQRSAAISFDCLSSTPMRLCV